MIFLLDTTKCRKHEKMERHIKSISQRMERGLCLSMKNIKPKYFQKYGDRCILLRQRGNDYSDGQQQHDDHKYSPAG